MLPSGLLLQVFIVRDDIYVNDTDVVTKCADASSIVEYLPCTLDASSIVEYLPCTCTVDASSIVEYLPCTVDASSIVEYLPCTVDASRIVEYLPCTCTVDRLLLCILYYSYFLPMFLFL